MATVSAAEVKKLRDATGAGMMDSKKALEEAAGDFDKADGVVADQGCQESGQARRADRWQRTRCRVG